MSAWNASLFPGYNLIVWLVTSSQPIRPQCLVTWSTMDQSERGRDRPDQSVLAIYYFITRQSVSLSLAGGEMILISLPFLTWSVIIKFWHLIITVWTRDISTPYELIHWEPRLLTTRQDKDNFTIKISLPSIFLKFLCEDKECQHIIILPSSPASQTSQILSTQL